MEKRSNQRCFKWEIWYSNKISITTNDEVKGKFEANWLGPFVCVEDIGSGAYRLSSIYGKEE